VRKLKIVAVEEVEVNGSWGVEGVSGWTAHEGFDFLEVLQQVQRRTGGRDLDGGIEEVGGIRRTIERGGFVDLGAQEWPGPVMDWTEVFACSAKI